MQLCCCLYWRKADNASALSHDRLRGAFGLETLENPLRYPGFHFLSLPIATLFTVATEHSGHIVQGVGKRASEESALRRAWVCGIGNEREGAPEDRQVLNQYRQGIG